MPKGRTHPGRLRAQTRNCKAVLLLLELLLLELLETRGSIGRGNKATTEENFGRDLRTNLNQAKLSLRNDLNAGRDPTRSFPFLTLHHANNRKSPNRLFRIPI